jgi:hypothetical protein
MIRFLENLISLFGATPSRPSSLMQEAHMIKASVDFL